MMHDEKSPFLLLILPCILNIVSSLYHDSPLLIKDEENTTGVKQQDKGCYPEKPQPVVEEAWNRLFLII
jgi:hypothetical protein